MASAQCLTFILLVAVINSAPSAADSSTATAATTTIKPNEMTLSLSKCNTTNFKVGDSCRIKCSLNDNGDQDYQYYSAALYYYTTDANTAVQLTTSLKSISIPDYTIYDYNAGTYTCKITIKRISTHTLTTYTDQFRVDTATSGVQLGDTCKTHQDCMALNAQCNVDGECECTGQCHIKYNKHGDSPACLAVGVDDGIDGSQVCNVDEECQAVEHSMDFKCQNGYCIYSGHHLRLLPAEIAYVTLGSVAVCLGCIALFHSMKRKKRD